MANYNDEGGRWVTGKDGRHYFIRNGRGFTGEYLRERKELAKNISGDDKKWQEEYDKHFFKNFMGMSLYKFKDLDESLPFLRGASTFRVYTSILDSKPYWIETDKDGTSFFKDMYTGEKLSVDDMRKITDRYKGKGIMIERGQKPEEDLIDKQEREIKEREEQTRKLTAEKMYPTKQEENDFIQGTKEAIQGLIEEQEEFESDEQSGISGWQSAFDTLSTSDNKWADYEIREMMSKKGSMSIMNAEKVLALLLKRQGISKKSTRQQILNELSTMTDKKFHEYFLKGIEKYL